MFYDALVFWLARPPYVRWLAAALLLAAAAAADLRGRATVPYPFAADTVLAGQPFAAQVDWREVPVGLLPDPGPTDGRAARDLAPGEPITAAAVASHDRVPAGWWAVPVDLPGTAAVGGRVRLVAPAAGLNVEGIVAAAPEAGPFAVTSPGLVAVPPEHAGAVAIAAAQGDLVIMLGT